MVIVYLVIVTNYVNENTIRSRTEENIMAKYGISVREILKRTVIVEAENLEEAIQKVEDAVKREEIILDFCDYNKREIVPSEYWGDGKVPDSEDVSFYLHIGSGEDKQRLKIRNLSEKGVNIENRTINYKGYVISTEEGIEKGVFFRNPLQKIRFDVYYDDPKMSGWKYLHNINNPFRRFFEILIGNGNIVKNVKEWSNDVEWEGFTGNILCCPIYFKRKYKKLNAVSGGSDDIQEINSYGYESIFEKCVGSCDKENTTIKMNSGKKIKIKRRSYHFTCEYIIEKIIDTGIIGDC